MTRTMLSLVLLAAFGFALTLQSPLLFKSSSKISGLNDTHFLNASELATTLEHHYKQNPREVPKTIYVFNVSVANTKTSQVVEAIRDMKSTKQIFANSPTGFVTNYFRYNKTAEVVDSVLARLGSIAGHFDRNVTNFTAFEKTITKRAKSSRFGADIVNVALSDIKSLDKFLIRAERTLAEKAGGHYLFVVVFDQNANASKITMTEEVNNRRMLQADGAAPADANANAGAAAADAPLAISSNTFTAIIVTLFAAAVTLIALNLLSDIKAPGTFISTPLNIGKEH